MNPRLILLFLLLIPVFAPSQNLYYPPNSVTEWETVDPLELNFCPDSITSLYSFLEDNQTKSFLLLKDGKIVLEEYFGTYTQDSVWIWFSAGKSLRAMLVGIAQEEGLLDINDPTSDYLGNGWTSLTADQEEAITIWHQLTMTSGLNPLNFDCTDPSCLTYLFPPGERWFYHNSPYNLTKEVLEAASGQNINQYTLAKIRNPIGM